MTRALPAFSGRMGTIALMLALTLLLSACLGKGPTRDGSGKNTNAQAVSALQQVNQAGMKCWFHSKDVDFRTLRMIPELDTIYGRPRLLLLKRNSPQSLPVMVIEAHDMPATIETYGPLTQTTLGNRINADIKRWSTNNQACAA